MAWLYCNTDKFTLGFNGLLLLCCDDEVLLSLLLIMLMG